VAKADTRVEQLFNSFVLKSGGELVSSLLAKDPQRPPNADYYFRDRNIIGELKCLQVDSLGSSYAAKLQALVDDWMRRDLLRVYGRASISLPQLHPICQREWMSLLERSMQNRFVDHANKQIKGTKRILNAHEAKGLLFVTSDGNTSLQPYDVLYFLDRTLKKKKPDGSPLYSNIRGVVYFTLSSPGYHQAVSMPILFWLGIPCDPNDNEMKTFMNYLETHWFSFIREVKGQAVLRMIDQRIRLQDIKIS